MTTEFETTKIKRAIQLARSIREQVRFEHGDQTTEFIEREIEHVVRIYCSNQETRAIYSMGEI